MANDGWISLHRQIQDNFLWKDKPFAKGQAWIDLLLMASHKDGERIYRGHYEKFRRGEVLTSITFLSERWGWQWKTTKRFIKMLENAEMVLTHGIPNGIAITIVKYDDFQGLGRANDRANDRTDDRTDDRAEDRRTIISNNFNNVNNSRSRGSTHKSFMQRRKEAWENLPPEWYEGEEDNENGLQEGNDGSEDSICG